MRKMIVMAFLFIGLIANAQDGKKPAYEQVEGDLIKVTYFYKDGNIKQQGFFNDKKVTGTWTTFDTSGRKTGVAKYKNGKKVGKWLLLTDNGMKEVVYKNNKVISVKTSYGNTSLAAK